MILVGVEINDKGQQVIYVVMNGMPCTIMNEKGQHEEPLEILYRLRGY